MLKKIIFANFQRIIDYFTLNLKLRPYIWVWDPGSVNYLFRIPDSKKAPDPDSQHWSKVRFLL
jgi:hypothetical protein